MKKPYYVYTLAYPDNTVFYVGKGSKRRIHMHEYDVKHNRVYNAEKTRIIKDIQASGNKVVKTIVARYTTAIEAYEHESRLIARLPNLANIHRGRTIRYATRYDKWIAQPAQQTRIKQLLDSL